MMRRDPMPLNLLDLAFVAAIAVLIVLIAASCQMVPATVGDLEKMRASWTGREKVQAEALDEVQRTYQKRLDAGDKKHAERMAAIEEEAEDRAMRVLEMALLGAVGVTGTGGVLLDRLRDRRRKKRGEKTETKEATA